MLELSSMTETHGDFLRNIHFQVTGQGLSPSIVLFTDEQMSYMKAFCGDYKTVIGVDKTYNLGELFVTALNFKFVSLHRRESGEPPVFVGPLFLHSSSTFDTFFYFFSVLAGVLFDNASPTSLVFGSDDEKALTRAIRAAFPNSRQALCTLHLKKNTIHHLRDRVGADTGMRNRLKEMLFRKTGLLEAQDRLSFDIQLQRLQDAWPGDDKSYLSKVSNQILTHALCLKWDGVLETADWTNNNAESINHVLKHMVGWTPQQLPMLVDKLRAMVKTQSAEVARALVGLCDMCLAPTHVHLQVSGNQWQHMSEEAKGRLMKGLLRPARVPRTVTSRCERFTVKSTPSKAKKPHQGKRKRSERTHTQCQEKKKARVK
ncbi:hypothetical protein ACOMHN_014768 [Nucella lapillus]